jgi:hypothetical protein
MSLMQLLTTGKSFSGIKDSEPRYRVTHQRVVPQFGPVKNPFCATGHLDNPRAEVGRKSEGAPVSSQPRVAAATPVPAPEPASPSGATRTNGPTLRLRSDQPVAANNFLSRAAAWRSKWAAKLTALFSRASGKPAKVTLTGPARAHVQGELALDRIKVVRNDLSDADLEVVPAKLPITKVKPAPALQATETPAAGGMTRGRLSGLFHAARS